MASRARRNQSSRKTVEGFVPVPRPDDQVWAMRQLAAGNTTRRHDANLVRKNKTRADQLRRALCE